MIMMVGTWVWAGWGWASSPRRIHAAGASCCSADTGQHWDSGSGGVMTVIINNNSKMALIMLIMMVIHDAEESCCSADSDRGQPLDSVCMKTTTWIAALQSP